MADAISTTLSGLRTTESPVSTTVYQTTDCGGQWYYDPLDTSSIDNTATIIVTEPGYARFKRIYTSSCDIIPFQLYSNKLFT